MEDATQFLLEGLETVLNEFEFREKKDSALAEYFLEIYSQLKEESEHWKRVVGGGTGCLSTTVTLVNLVGKEEKIKVRLKYTPQTRDEGFYADVFITIEDTSLSRRYPHDSKPGIILSALTGINLNGEYRLR